MIDREDAVFSLQSVFNDETCPPHIADTIEHILYGLEEATPPNYTIMKYKKTKEQVKVYKIDFEKMEAMVFDIVEDAKSGNGWKKVKLSKLVPNDYK